MRATTKTVMAAPPRGFVSGAYERATGLSIAIDLRCGWWSRPDALPARRRGRPTRVVTGRPPRPTTGTRVGSGAAVLGRRPVASAAAPVAAGGGWVAGRKHRRIPAGITTVRVRAATTRGP